MNDRNAPQRRKCSFTVARFNELHAPAIRQYGRRDAEADGVSQRIQFGAECRGCVRHARDAAIDAIQQHGKADGLGGENKMTGRFNRVRRHQHCALHGAQQRQITQKDVTRREQRGQRVSGPRGGRLGPLRLTKQSFLDVHRQRARAERLRTVGAVRQDAGTGGNAHARAHFEHPFRSEDHVHARTEFNQADAIAGIDEIARLLLKTMRRAISPAICLKTTRVPSPCTVTVFISFCHRCQFAAGDPELVPSDTSHRRSRPKSVSDSRARRRYSGRC